MPAGVDRPDAGRLWLVEYAGEGIGDSRGDAIAPGLNVAVTGAEELVFGTGLSASRAWGGISRSWCSMGLFIPVRLFVRMRDIPWAPAGFWESSGECCGDV